MAVPGRSVAGIAVSGGKIFIARRKEGGDLGGKWEFPGGKVEEGETDEEALVREYREEFGVSVQAGPLLGTAVFEHRGVRRVLNGYRIYFSPAGCKLAEHTRWLWASPGDIEKLDFAGSDLLLLPGLKSFLAGLESPDD
jgi:8-oxo-dGTP diphosphatase